MALHTQFQENEYQDMQTEIKRITYQTHLEDSEGGNENDGQVGEQVRCFAKEVPINGQYRGG